MSNIDKRALREAAETIASGYQREWVVEKADDYAWVGTYDDDGGFCGFIKSAISDWSDNDEDGDRLAAFIAAANPSTVLALLDELEAAENTTNELNDALCKLLPGVQYMDPPDGGSVTPIEQVTRMVADYREKIEAAEKRIAELRELLQWAHDTLLEINPNNYTHDDVCEINSASVEVILGIAPVLGETHGKSEEWWAARAAGTAKGE